MFLPINQALASRYEQEQQIQDEKIPENLTQIPLRSGKGPYIAQSLLPREILVNYLVTINLVLELFSRSSSFSPLHLLGRSLVFSPPLRSSSFRSLALCHQYAPALPASRPAL